MQVDIVLDAGALIGESPVWSAEERVLYWIDIKAPALYRLDPDSKSQQNWKLPAEIGAYALTSDRNIILVALRSGIFLLDLASGGLQRMAEAPYDPELFRFNEGACDSRGRFWVGMMFDPLHGNAQPAQDGHLSCYTSRDGLRRVGDAAELHNGMSWNREEDLFYIAHSNSSTIHAYPFDAETGALGPRGLFAVIEQGAGIPDGSASDAEGGYWCALHGGSALRRYRGDGTLDREIKLPVSQPTMCAFGGPALDILYVTSAAQGLDAEQRKAEPHAGALLALRPGISGLPREHRFLL